MSMRILAAVTILFGLAPLATADEKRSSKVYPVADLVIPIEGAPGHALAKTTATGGVSGIKMENGVAVPEPLIKLITATVKPASWSRNGGPGSIDYYAMGMGLVVNQTPEVHREIAELLQALRELQD